MIEYFVGLFLIAIGLYALVAKDHFIKKIFGLSLVSEGTHLLLMTIGFRHTLEDAIPPIQQIADVQAFAARAVDPLPQALVLTSIVINFSVTAFALILAMKIYERTGTLRTKGWAK